MPIFTLSHSLESFRSNCIYSFRQGSWQIFTSAPAKNTEEKEQHKKKSLLELTQIIAKHEFLVHSNSALSHPFRKVLKIFIAQALLQWLYILKFWKGICIEPCKLTLFLTEDLYHNSCVFKCLCLNCKIYGYSVYEIFGNRAFLQGLEIIQMARCFVRSFPFYPDIPAIAAWVAVSNNDPIAHSKLSSLESKNPAMSS